MQIRSLSGALHVLSCSLCSIKFFFFKCFIYFPLLIFHSSKSRLKITFWVAALRGTTGPIISALVTILDSIKTKQNAYQYLVCDHSMSIPFKFSFSQAELHFVPCINS